MSRMRQCLGLEPTHSHHLSPGRIPRVGSAIGVKKKKRTWGTQSRMTIYERKTRGEHKVLILLFSSSLAARGWASCTHMIVQILHKGVATGLAAKRASLMKEVVEAHEFAKLGEDLDESISEERRNPLCLVRDHVPGDGTHSSTVG